MFIEFKIITTCVPTYMNSTENILRPWHPFHEELVWSWCRLHVEQDATNITQQGCLSVHDNAVMRYRPSDTGSLQET